MVIKGGRGDQISWLNNLPPRRCRTGRRAGPGEWWMRRRGGGIYVPCGYEWSVFITLGPLSCQKARMVLEGGEQVEGGAAESQSAFLRFIHFLAHTHIHNPHSLCPSSRAAQFTVRPFNFPEIGMWQLCHADEKSGSLSHAIYLSGDSAELPSSLLFRTILHVSSLFLTCQTFSPSLSEKMRKRAAIGRRQRVI